MNLYLGIAREDTTPEIGARIYGYRPDVYSESVHDRLSTAVFAFKCENVISIMISASVCLMSSKISDELRKIISEENNIDINNIVIACTHTHSGPALHDQSGWGDLDMEYYNNIFKPAVLKATADALNSLEPVKVGLATGESLVGVNRRELTIENSISFGQKPWGPFDPKMTVISFKNNKDEVVANIIHYGAHQTAAGNRPIISRDWSGVMVDAVEAESGGITVFFNGPEGDIGPRLSNGRTVGDMSYVEELGQVAANDALKIYRNISSYDDVEFTVNASDVCIPLVPRIPYPEAVKAFEEANLGDGVNLTKLQYEHCRWVKESYENGYVEKESKCIKQVAIRIGKAVFISFPYELFTEIGLRIDKEFPGYEILSLSNANGSEGYFPTSDQMCLGGYEVAMFKYTDIQQCVDNADYYLVAGSVENVKKLLEE